MRCKFSAVFSCALQHSIKNCVQRYYFFLTYASVHAFFYK